MNENSTASTLRRHEKYDRLIAAAKRQASRCHRRRASLRRDLAREARSRQARPDLIKPILVGPKDKIAAVAKEFSLDLGGIEIVDVPHSQAAAEKAVELVRTGKAELLMKGSLHTDELLAEVMKRETGLRTGRRISHVFVMDVPGHAQTLFITDAAVNIAPDLDVEARHHPERHRPLCRAWAWHAEGRHPLRRRDGDADHSLDHRGGGAVQDGGSRPDHRRRARWSARLRQCHQPRGGAHQGHQIAGCGPSADPGRAGPRSRQHAGQEPDVPVPCRCRGHRARRTRADHPHLARGPCAHAPGLLRRGCAATATARWRSSRSGPEPMSETILVVNAGSSSIKFQLFSVGAGDRLAAPPERPDRGHRRPSAPRRQGREG